MKRRLLAGLSVAYSVMAMNSAQAVAPSSLAQVPLFLVNSAEAQVMLNMSNDHQLFYKAYDDWSDVNGDGVIDITYDHSIDYYGYFDAHKCYDYSTTNGRFEPAAVTSDKYCDSVSGEWSGNFLNWATMTRIDTVRKILYGGLRSTDTATDTVLERAFLPNDAHSFAKYYEETDAGEIAKLTPWSVSSVTFCNTTYASSGVSQNVTAPPLLRAAEGNFALWAANERWQCHWHDHNSEAESDIFNSPNPGTNNGNDSSTTGLSASADNPDWDDDRLGIGDYTVRVEACVAGLIGNEKCKVYPDLNSKPIGLLQEYGDDGQILFGLMTGSFQKNKSGGTLRKNVGPLTDEINTTTNGTFKTAPAAGNIISNLSSLRVYGYCFGSCTGDRGTYNHYDNCSWGLNTFNNGSCTNWGNPQSEIYLESLRYFAGASATSTYAANDTGYLSNLITATTWTDPLSNDNYCAPLNVIQFNASVSSYDTDELSSASALDGIGSESTVTEWTNKIGAIPPNGEGIDGNEFFIGTGTWASTGLCTEKTLDKLGDAEGLCPEAPRLGGGFDIAGLAYYAHTESIRDDLDDSNGVEVEVNVKTYGVTLSPAVPKIEVPVPGGDVGDVVATILPACRNESISGNCAIVDFKVVERHHETVPNTGIYAAKFYVNWEDSEQGGDYDQDMAGVLEYTLDWPSQQLTVTTHVFADSTPNKMGFGYIIGGTTQDGFHTHSGINYFTGFADITGVDSCNLASITCETGIPATSFTYDLGTSDGQLLKDPLYYAAKWGGFEEDEYTVSEGGSRPEDADAPNDLPDQAYEWDDNADGLPDAYFYSTNPAELETSLAAVFLDVSAGTSAASSTAANSYRVSTGTTIYQSRFNPLAWTGELLAFAVDEVTGAISDTQWEAGAKLDAVAWNARVIITNVDGAGEPFEWSDLNATQQALLNVDPDTLAADTNGEKRLEYLRGSDELEVKNTGPGVVGIFRDRLSKLGDLVNSSPVYVGAANFGYPDWLERYEDISNPGNLTNSAAESYGAFKTRIQYRTHMLYVGGNDGMLHGFTADATTGGNEALAFVPNAVYANLTQLTSPDYEHRYFVDGSPARGDVLFNDNQWHSILLGGLNAGGRGIYALDITNPAGYTEAAAGNVFLWEIEATVGGDFDDLGYTYSRPLPVKNHAGTNAFTYEAGEGKWVAMFGNGYASAAGKAVLYVVDAQTGALVDSVVADSSGDNGLSSVAPVDLDGDYKTDVIYAGDLKGNLWKFVPDGTLGGWKVDFGGQPLFTAPSSGSASVVSNLQPITMRPEVGTHPDNLPGVMVYFGTGSYFEVGDNVGDADTQSVYGIWDAWDECNNNDGTRKVACTSSYSKVVSPPSLPVSPPTDPSFIDRDNLLKQCVTASDGATCMTKLTTPTTTSTATGSVGEEEVRLVSQNTLDVWDWDVSRGYMGWYMDLPDYGEKQVTKQTLRGGRLIFVTVVPSQHACEAGGESWLMEVDARTGGRLDEIVFDLNGDGVFGYDDNLGGSSDGGTEGQNASGRRIDGVAQDPNILDAAGDGSVSEGGGGGGKEFKYQSTSKGNIEVTTESRSSSAVGRKSWVRVK